MKKHPFVSVIIVNYNAKNYLRSCLEAVVQNTYPNYEVLVVDNGSTDGSNVMVAHQFGDRVQLLPLAKNFGPAYARNRGVEQAQGKYLAFLDNDTIPDKNWLGAAVGEMEKDISIGAVQCKLLLASDRKKFDYAGDYLSQYGFLVQRVEASVVDHGQFDQKDEILSAKSAAMLIRKDVFEEVGGFDEDYFIYLEETDLGWRTWLAGYRIIFVPDSVVYHEFGTTSLLEPKLQSFNAKFHGTKNYITTLIKNFGWFNTLKIVPVHTIIWLGLGGYLISKGSFREGFYVWRGVLWCGFHLPRILEKRRRIQSTRAVAEGALMKKLLKKVPFGYFWRKATVSETVGHAESFVRTEGRI
ncbi:glycosyltransferase family 2 protein [Candidatus Parcubacteria bacterium]|nr:glycosyltransferase family 2 protein [Candidatus Parcubacteria bacterium]